MIILQLDPCRDDLRGHRFAGLWVAWVPFNLKLTQVPVLTRDPAAQWITSIASLLSHTKSRQLRREQSRPYYGTGPKKPPSQ